VLPFPKTGGVKKNKNIAALVMQPLLIVESVSFAEFHALPASASQPVMLWPQAMI